ncbi:MAG: hypothetical protein Q4C14_03740, partial [Bacillota bacterium]|nr:hypothetical protein [Bacillota bacterium]
MRFKTGFSIRHAIFVCLIFICFAGGGAAAAAQDGSTAAYASSAIDVDGTDVNIEGYNINGNNYFKLRDIAAALKGTDKQFQVEYDLSCDKVMITPGLEYEPDGTETYVPEDPDALTVVPAVSEVYFGEEKLELDAYNVNGYNFVKLRDAAQMMDFALMYYDDTKRVSFITDKDYSQSEEFYPEPPKDPETVTDASGLFSTQAINDYSK